MKIFKNWPEQGIKSNEKLYDLECAVTDIYDLYLYFCFNGNTESTVMEMALIEVFCSYNVNKMRKDPFTSVVILIFRSQCNI